MTTHVHTAYTLGGHRESSGFRDAMTMLRRDWKRSLRNPMMTVSSIVTPVVFMLIFVGMFGDVMAAQLGGPAGGYVSYLTPGIVVMGLASGVAATAVNLSVDKNEGVIARFRTMAIARTSVLTGQVAGAVLRSVVSVACIFGVAFALGFRSQAGLLGWLGALGLVALSAIALTWLGTAFGLLSGSAATANSMSLIPQFLPLVSSGFVPPERMPDGMQWFGEHQPFTPIIETLRGLVTGAPVGSSWMAAVAWCLVIWAAAFVWARWLYNREPTPRSGPSVSQLLSH
ncbi:ABC transporter permease [Intrasporangium sp.]|uniref:ABC transporter permease n=1 Tax=Intrasporangium sp. TaxID=1925024 RepID=UPI002939E713|nr:ABC transporter permease [Intrasporangium sp.]MDV3220243.1 ABC transporter permease [Intrasporangium sp.]